MTAVVVDDWPLVRVGIVQALTSVDISVVAQTSSGEDGVRQVEVRKAGHLLLGAHGDLAGAEAARRAKALEFPPKVVVLLDHVDREEMAVLAGAGVEGFLVRSVHPAELATALRRVIKGERVVAVPLLSLLVGGLAVDPAGDSSVAERRGVVLTRKEVEVLARLAEGRSNREIAEALFVTPATVKTHLAHIYDKLGVSGRGEAMERALALGLLHFKPGQGRGNRPPR